MQWLDQLNEALNYVEDNLDSEISYGEASRIAGCSTYHFQRMFSYIAGATLSEYIRRRRMTNAAFDLQNGAKVLDVALKYGYDSPTAFNRAFKALHGVAPSAAQQGGTPLRAFPRIGFQMTIKGEEEMEYQIVKKDAFRIVGVRDPLKKDYEESFKRVPVFWQESQPAIPRLCEVMDGEPKGILGLSTCDGDDAENHYYIAVASNKPIPNGMYEYTVPAAQWAIFKGHGKMPDAIQALQKRIFAEWLPASGYEWAQAPDIEVYPEPASAEVPFEVWLPIQKK